MGINYFLITIFAYNLKPINNENKKRTSRSN